MWCGRPTVRHMVNRWKCMEEEMVSVERDGGSQTKIEFVALDRVPLTSGCDFDVCVFDFAQGEDYRASAVPC